MRVFLDLISLSFDPTLQPSSQKTSTLQPTFSTLNQFPLFNNKLYVKQLTKPRMFGPQLNHQPATLDSWLINIWWHCFQPANIHFLLPLSLNPLDPTTALFASERYVLIKVGNPNYPRLITLFTHCNLLTLYTIGSIFTWATHSINGNHLLIHESAMHIKQQVQL